MPESANLDLEAIRRRAHEISLSPDAGTAEENWLRAEDELRRPISGESARPEEKPVRNAETNGLPQELSAPAHP
jgi:hypothetical protein